MFKKIKESEAYKKLLSNLQVNAIISLGLWLLFFGIIIFFVRGIGSSSTKEEVNLNSKLYSYEYTYKNNKITIFGKAYHNKQVFTVLNNKYYYNGENVYLLNDREFQMVPNFDLGILKVTPFMINNLTDNSSFTENNGVKQYLVPLVNFINLYEIDTDVDLSAVSNYNIVIRKYYLDSELYKFEIDLTNYYRMNNLDDSGILTINLYNKNKLNDFTLEYDMMLGVR